LQAPGYESTREKGDDSLDDVSLVLNEMRSLPEFLPVLSVIPEVRRNIWAGCDCVSKSMWHIVFKFFVLHFLSLLHTPFSNAASTRVPAAVSPPACGFN
jgi:hypothetical protein